MEARKLILPGAFTVLLAATACGSSSPPLPAGQLVIATPTEGAITNGAILVSIRSTGTAPERVTLDVDGTLTRTLAPPFEVTLDTGGLAEGSHTLHARDTSDAGTINGAERSFSVDRTPPQILLQWPASGSEVRADWAPIVLTFDEPLLPSSLDAGALLLTQENVRIPLTAALSEGGRILTLTPGALPPHHKPVGFSLSSPGGFATDLAGNPAFAISTDWTLPFWELLGGPIDPTPGAGSNGYPHLVLSPDAGPVVASHEFVPTFGGNQIWVAERGSEKWHPLATVPIPLPNASVYLDSLTLDPEAHPVIAFFGYDLQGASYNRAARWSGTRWDFVGGDLLAPGSYVLASRITSDVAGALWALVGIDDGGYTDWFVVRWDGTSWTPVGNRVNEAGAWSAASGGIRVSRTGVPYVSFAQSGTQSTGTMVHVWDGANWSPLGGEITLTGHPGSAPSTPRLELDDAGRPVVLMDEYFDTGWHSLVWRWSGQGWELLGAPIGAPVPADVVPPSGALALGPGDVPSIALLRPDGGVPTAQVYELDAGTWVEVGPGLVSPHGSELRMYPEDVALAVDPEGRRLVAVTVCTTGVCSPSLFREVR